MNRQPEKEKKKKKTPRVNVCRQRGPIAGGIVISRFLARPGESCPSSVDSVDMFLTETLGDLDGPALWVCGAMVQSFPYGVVKASRHTAF